MQRMKARKQQVVQSEGRADDDDEFVSAYATKRAENKAVNKVIKQLSKTREQKKCYTWLSWTTISIIDIKGVLIFSDGPANQFKNQYLVAYWRHFSMKRNANNIVNFFCTSHGKGAVDGIGATVKQVVWRDAKTGKRNVSSAKDFYECLQTHDIAIESILVNNDTIDELYEPLKFEDMSYQIKGIKQSHQWKFHNGGFCMNKLSGIANIPKQHINN